MEISAESGALLVLGLLLVVPGIGLLDAGHDNAILSEVVKEGDPPDGANVTGYADLPPPAQSAVDEVIREEYTILSTEEDATAVEALRGYRYVQKNGTVYYLRTTSADGDGGFFHLIAGNALLAMGGLLVGAAAYRSTGGRRHRSVVLFPVCATVSLLAGTVIGGAGSPEDLRFVLSLGFSTTVPVVFGIAARQRAFPLGIGGLVLLVVTLGVLFLGPGSLALPILMGLVALGVPGGGLGWWVAGSQRDESNANPTT